jgi:hypothetical protein
MISINSIFVGRAERITEEDGVWESSIFRQAVFGTVELGPQAYRIKSQTECIMAALLRQSAFIQSSITSIGASNLDWRLHANNSAREA